jgi:hypothetical protein
MDTHGALGGDPVVVTAPPRVKRYNRKTTHDASQGGPVNICRHLFEEDHLPNQSSLSCSALSFLVHTPKSQTLCRGKGFASKRKSTEGYKRAAKRAKQQRVLADDPIQAVARLRELSAFQPLFSDRPAEPCLGQGKKVDTLHDRGSAVVR